MFIERSDKKFLTLKEAAKISGYTSDHLARLVRTSEIRGRRIGRFWLVTRGDLENYLSSQNRDGSHANRDFVTLKEASKFSGYTADHIARIIRNREIEGKRAGRIWLVSKDGLSDYINERNKETRRERVLREDIAKREWAEKTKAQFHSYVSGFENAVSSFASSALDFTSKKTEALKQKSSGFSDKTLENSPATAESLENGQAEVVSSKNDIHKTSSEFSRKDIFKNGAIAGFAFVMAVFFVSGFLAYAGYTPQDTLANSRVYSRMFTSPIDALSQGTFIQDINSLPSKFFKERRVVTLEFAETRDLIKIRTDKELQILEASFIRIFGDAKNGYANLNKKFTDFLGEKYLAVTEKLIPGYSPYKELVVHPPRGPSKITEIIREQIETITKIQPFKEIIKEREIIKETVKETEVIKEKEIVVKEGGDTSSLSAEIDALKKNISVINGDISDVRRDIVSRVNNVSRGGGLPSIPSDLSSGGTINRLTLGAISDVSGNSLSIESGNIAISSGGTINQTGSGQVTFTGNVDANGGLDTTTLTASGATTLSGNLTVSGNTNLSNTVTINGVAYSFPSADGSSSQRLTTDGSGTLAWETVSSSGGSNWQFTTHFGADALTTTSSIPVWVQDALYASSTLRVEGIATLLNTTTSFNGVSYGFPSSGGANGQALVNDGTGILSWSTVAGDNFFTDGGTFTYMTTTTQDFVLGASSATGAPFFFDVSTRRLGINTYDGSPASFLEIQGNDSGLNTIGTGVALTINNASTTAFDSYIDFQTASTTRWLLGVDDSDSDKFRIATSSFSAVEGLTIDRSSGYFGIGTSAPTTALQVASDIYLGIDGSAIFNEAGNAQDFRIEGDTLTNLFFLDGSADKIGINDPTPGSLLTVSATGTLAFGDFNDNTIDDMESTIINWASSDTANTATSTATSTDSTSTTAPKAGTQALRITTSGNSSVGNTVRKTFSSNQDYSTFERISFWLYATAHSTSTSQIISFQINDTTNGTSDHNITMQDTNRWQYEEVDLTTITTSTEAYDGIDYVQFVIDNATSSPTFVIDHVRVYDSDERSAELAVDGDGNIVMTGRGGVELVTGNPGSGQLPNLKVSNATVEVNNPLAINVGGDVGIDYDLQFLNTGTSYITSEGSLRIEAGDANHAENLTLGTQGTGDVVIDINDASLAGSGGFKVLGASGSVMRLDPNGQFIVGGASSSTAPFFFNSSARRLGINVYDGNLSSILELQDNDSGLNSAGGNVVLTINNASTTAFDPIIDFQTASTTRWFVGVDDSDGNKFRIATSSFAGNAEGITISATSGFVGIGTVNPATKLEIVGGDCSDDAGGGGCTSDYAEYYNSSEDVEKGDIVAIDAISAVNPESQFAYVKRANSEGDRRVIGVVSTSPAIIIDGSGLSFSANSYELDPKRPAVALKGRVFTKVSLENGPIEVGDPITVSSVAGVGMKATESGNILGYSLQAFGGLPLPEVSEGKNFAFGKILIFLDFGYSKLTVSDGQDPDLTLESLSERQDELEKRVSLLEFKLNDLGVLDNNPSLSKATEGKQNIFGSIAEALESFGGKISDGIFSIKNLVTGKLAIEKFEDENKNTVGEGVIIAGATSTDISAPIIGIWDKVFITPETPVSIAVSGKIVGEGFSVSIAEPTSSDIYFDWWIVGVELKSQTPMINDQSNSNNQVQNNENTGNCEERVTYGWNPNPPEGAPLGAENGGECKVFDISCAPHAASREAPQERSGRASAEWGLPEGYIEVENCSTKTPIRTPIRQTDSHKSGDESAQITNGDENASSTENGVDSSDESDSSDKSDDNATTTDNGVDTSDDNAISTDSGAKNATTTDSGADTSDESATTSDSGDNQS